jgi:hypothetical protein
MVAGASATARAQQHPTPNAHTPAHRDKTATKPVLQPAEGARVKILTPKNGETFKGDSVPLEFSMTKGKHGQHVHAYVNGELMGMFTGNKGTLTGIKPGRHTLELRVGTADHRELNASDRLSFVTE